MTGMPLDPNTANQDWPALLYAAMRALADCNGTNDLINDANRNPGGGAAGLVARGFAQADADLYVAAFAAMAALWKHSTNAQAAQMTDFWFQARQTFGTRPTPK